MVKGMIEKLQVDSEGRAITVSVATILKGSRPRTFSYTGTVGTGQSGMTSKWDVELMCQRTSRKICVRGNIRIPPYSMWKVNDIRSETPVFLFHNTLGYGYGSESWEMEVRTTIHPSRGTFDVEITNTTRTEQTYKYTDVPMSMSLFPLAYMYPMSYVTDPLSMGMKAITGKTVYPVCTLEGKHITTFDNRTTKADI